MPREIVLSCLFAVALTLPGMAQDVPEPIPASAASSPSPSVSPAATPAASPSVSDAAPAPAANPSSAADEILMPATSGTSESSLFANPPKAENGAPVDTSEPAGPDETMPEPKHKTKNPIKDDLKDRIHYRQARTKALVDGKLQDQWDLAEHAKTQPERRQILTGYYNELFKRVIAIDPSVKPMAQKDHDTAIQRLSQKRLRTAEESAAQTGTASGNEAAEDDSRSKTDRGNGSDDDGMSRY